MYDKNSLAAYQQIETITQACSADKQCYETCLAMSFWLEFVQIEDEVNILQLKYDLYVIILKAGP